MSDIAHKLVQMNCQRIEIYLHFSPFTKESDLYQNNNNKRVCSCNGALLPYHTTAHRDGVPRELVNWHIKALWHTANDHIPIEKADGKKRKNESFAFRADIQTHTQSINKVRLTHAQTRFYTCKHNGMSVVMRDNTGKALKEKKGAIKCARYTSYAFIASFQAFRHIVGSGKSTE